MEGVLQGVEAELARLGSIVDQRLANLLPAETESPPELHAAMRYAVLGSGKRLRPALTLLSARKESGVALEAACAVELVHAFSLVHDDLPAIDNDDLRRGRPTCHRVYGEAVAVLAGDALFSLAFEVLAHLEAPATLIVALLRELTTAAGTQGLVGGETTDVLMEGRAVSAEVLSDIHARKTGALLAASCAMGAIAGGRSEGEVACLREFGAQLGLAFQIADDLLNASGSAEVLGKATGSDGDRQKATYPALYGLEEAQRMAFAAAESARSVLPEGETFLAELTHFAVNRRR